VIEKKLLTALEDENTVAILASKRDLNLYIDALRFWDMHLSIPERRKHLAEMLAGLKQLRASAFRPNHRLGHTEK